MSTSHNILKQYWGYDTFRAPQEEIIEAVLAGRDTLALMPTGGGKSVCFQVPALMQEGVCIVVSPLIALMKDQVYQLKKRNIPAEAIYSGLHYKDIDRIFDNAVYGQLKLLYLSPERLITDLAKARIALMKLNLLAVDEAHCISQWGYDFRPPYLKIASIRALHPKVPILALTATATEQVALDIQEKLQFKTNNVIQKSFARSNLAYVVLQEEDKEKKLLDIATKVKGSGVVYVRSRKQTKELAMFLQKNNVAADFYHAGLDAPTRSQKQDAWINNEVRVIVSTNAFGMGIDKPDVRFVVHIDLPDSLEAYFQEAGRAGRDELKAYAVLLYNSSDKFRLENEYEQAFPDMNTIRQTYRALGSYCQLAVGGGEGTTYDFDIVVFTKQYKLDMILTFNVLKILEQEGWLSVSESVWMPAQVQILVDNETLYDYQLRHPKLDKLLKVILRTTQGSFHHLVKVRESQLAKTLNISLEEVKAFLQRMHQDRIIEYLPQKDIPQLTFLQERVEADNLTINQANYQFRKQRHLERIQQSIQYAQAQTCRSQQLLTYFDEINAPLCGVCDVCLERNKSSLSTSDMEAYTRKIKQLLIKESLTLEALVDSFTPKRKQQVLKVIAYLLEEQKIEKMEDKLIWK